MPRKTTIVIISSLSVFNRSAVLMNLIRLELRSCRVRTALYYKLLDNSYTACPFEVLYSAFELCHINIDINHILLVM